MYLAPASPLSIVDLTDDTPRYLLKLQHNLSLLLSPGLRQPVLISCSCLKRLNLHAMSPLRHCLEVDSFSLANKYQPPINKASAYNSGDLGLIPGSGRSPGEGNGNPLQYSCLENSMDGGAWQATVHGVAKNRTRLSDFTFTFFHLLIAQAC